MKSRQVIETVSVIGVVGSLLFVGLEVRQSNVIARQQALQTIIGEWNDLAVPWALDARFSELAERVREGVVQADLSGGDRQSLHVMFLAVNHTWEFRYRQVQVGVLSPDDFEYPDPERNRWFNSNFHREVWPLSRDEFQPEFTAFWEERFNLPRDTTSDD